MAYRSLSKLEEQSHLRRFAESELMISGQNLDYRDEPDCVIKINSEVVGLEHTRICEPTLKRVESLEEKIITRARCLYEETSRPPLSVAAIFNLSKKSLSTKDTESIARKIVKLVISSVPSNYEDVFVEPNWQNHAWFPEELSGLFVQRLKDNSEVIWDVGRGGCVPSVTEEMINQRISRKEKELPKYKANLHAYAKRSVPIWLLVVLDGFAPSSDYELPQSVKNARYTSRFDRIYLFRNFTREAVSLKVSAK